MAPPDVVEYYLHTNMTSFLIQRLDVRKELGLSEESFSEIVPVLRAESEAASRLGDLPRDPSMLQEWNSNRMALGERYEHQILDHLSPSQIQRLRQLDHQYLGIASRALPTMTEEQKKTLHQMALRKMRDSSELRRSYRAGELERQAYLDRATELSDALTREEMAILTEAQRDKWATTIGVPFRFERHVPCRGDSFAVILDVESQLARWKFEVGENGTAKFTGRTSSSKETIHRHFRISCAAIDKARDLVKASAFHTTDGVHGRRHVDGGKRTMTIYLNGKSHTVQIFQFDQEWERDAEPERLREACGVLRVAQLIQEWCDDPIANVYRDGDRRVLRAICPMDSP